MGFRKAIVNNGGGRERYEKRGMQLRDQDVMVEKRIVDKRRKGGDSGSRKGGVK